MSVKVIPDMTTNYVHHDFARNTGERNWPVVHREVSVPLLEDRGNKRQGPVVRNLSVSRDFWEIVVKIGASSAASSRRILHGMLSGPEAFLTLSPASNFSTPLVLILRGEMRGVLGPDSLGILSTGDCGGVKTDLNCLFKISALSVASECNWPSTLRIELTYQLSNFSF